VDGEGYVIIADRNNDRVRKIAPDGTVSTLAAQFKHPEGVAADCEEWELILLALHLTSAKNRHVLECGRGRQSYYLVSSSSE
jgi:hypothetical protein